jgi:hypothetical protein
MKPNFLFVLYYYQNKKGILDFLHLLKVELKKDLNLVILNFYIKILLVIIFSDIGLSVADNRTR